MKALYFLMALFTLIIISGKAAAVTLFVDDFEAGLSDDWIIGHLGGQSVWEVVEMDGNSVLKADSTGGGWTGATYDGVADIQSHGELWATCKFMAQQELGSCNELGLLTNPDSLNGNWYLSTCEGGNEIGIDECGIVWHNRVAYPWKLDQWYNAKVMVSQDSVMYGKIWLIDEEEPADWNTQETLTSHLEEDGVGLMSYNGITYFDEVIVASAEEDLVMAVAPNRKFSITWGVLKSKNGINHLFP